jgi:hypothetical protein
VHALNIAQSISGALHRVSTLRSPGSGGGEAVGAAPSGGGQLAAVDEAAPESGPGGITSDSIPLDMFSCPGAAGFKVRGPNYLQDKKKVQQPRLTASRGF